MDDHRHRGLHEPIHVFIRGCPDDARVVRTAPPGVIYHDGPALHPDDCAVVDGIPCTSVPRTLIACAEDATPDELRAMFLRADELGILDNDAVNASLARAEWQPSLPLVQAILAEFRG